MKFAASAALTALAWTATTASHAAILLHDPSSVPGSDSQQSSLSPVAARCLIAQRAGVLQYHADDLSGAYGDEAIAAINDYGIRTPLSGESVASLRRATILLEGVDDISALSASLHAQQSLFLDAVPPLANARGLLIDLFQQSENALLNSASEQDAVGMFAENTKKNIDGDIFHIAHTGDAFGKLFARLVQEKVHITTIALSSTAESGTSPWGTYEMPDAQTSLQKRGNTGKSRALGMKQLSSRQDTTYNGSLPGILAACYTSLSACQSTTLNCTGHGQCVQKYSGESDSNSGSSQVPCYSCRCGTTVSENARGQKKTTYWGGPACQKRDISSSFWLIALFTVGMVFLISFGVGQLWTMGEEDLPSVIGAGVSGPVRRS